MTDERVGEALCFSDVEVGRLSMLLERGRRIVLLPHTAPDGDALGSVLGLLGVLRSAYPEADIRAVSPDAVERYLQWMPCTDQLVVWSSTSNEALDLIASADVLIHLDHNEVTRLRHSGLVEAVKTSRATRIMIDHHLNPEEGFHLVLSRPGVSSTSELVYALAKRMGWTKYLISELATLLLTGIVTDTGRLMYGCFYPEIFAHFSELIAHGADYPYIIDSLSYHGTMSQLRLQGYALYERMEIYPELRTAVISLSAEEMQTLGVSKGDTEGLVNLPLSVEGIEASCFIREDGDQIKLSFRSIGDLAVNEVARRAFGGGGHLNAAGGEYKNSAPEVYAGERLATAKNIYLRELGDYLQQR